MIQAFGSLPHAKPLIFSAIALAVLWPPAYSQNASGQADCGCLVRQPRTTLAKFEYATQSVIIKARSIVGSVRGTDGDTIRIEYDIFTNVTQSYKAYGVSLGVVPADAKERRTRYYVDYDELDSLLKGIDYIIKMNPSVSDLATYEAEYRSKGDLEISTFSDSHGAVRVAVYDYVCGSSRTALDLPALIEMQRYLVAAKAKLDSILSER